MEIKIKGNNLLALVHKYLNQFVLFLFNQTILAIISELLVETAKGKAMWFHHIKFNIKKKHYCTTRTSSL